MSWLESRLEVFNKQKTYTVNGLTSEVEAVHIQFRPNGDIWFAPSSSAEMVFNYWSVLKFNDLWKWLSWYPYPIVYHNLK